MAQVAHREYIDFPDPPDESDPEFKDEIFETYKYMGWNPEEIDDPMERAEYAAWLRNQSESL